MSAVLTVLLLVVPINSIPCSPRLRTTTVTAVKPSLPQQPIVSAGVRVQQGAPSDNMHCGSGGGTLDSSQNINSHYTLTSLTLTHHASTPTRIFDQYSRFAQTATKASPRPSLYLPQPCNQASSRGHLGSIFFITGRGLWIQ